ncbi:MAG TPA: hypothetical protein VF843_16240 [Streptosporangiaceae bacterium]
MDNRFAAARGFLLRNGRLLERRLFAACFEGAGPAGVADAVRGYRNPDGGFGHALEPDTRCPASLPIYTEVALQSLATAGAAGQDLVNGACEYLAGVAAQAGAGGAVPPASSIIESYPRAAHWTDWTYQPSVNPTAGLVAVLHRLGARHRWLDQATGWCWEQIEAGELPGEVHSLSEIFAFLEQAADRDRAAKAAARALEQLSKADMFLADPEATGYGLTPLSIAPQAGSRWRGLFGAEMIDGHLDRMLRDQQPDGGWPITWDPPSDAARLEWRGIVTLSALRTLVSYGRLDPAA